MDNLYIKLCPFSPDYSGASSVLYDFNSVSVLHDASGCTGNYTGYDEWRWAKKQKAILCSGLRELDAVLGDDEKLIDKTLESIKILQPELISVMGTPVPMVIGTDVKGIAREIEYLSGVPSIGIDTTGMKLYDYGVYLSSIELIEKLANKNILKVAKSVNVLGVNAIDFSDFNSVTEIINITEKQGFKVISCGMCRMGVNEIRDMLAADFNIAVTKAGLMIAEYIKNNYDIPYICAIPVGSAGKESFIQALHKQDIYSQVGHHCTLSQPKRKVLILGEQVMANGIRYTLEKDFNLDGVTVGCIFGLNKTIAREYDLDLTNETKIFNAMNDEYELVIGDGMFKDLVHKVNLKFIEIPHYGVSSKTSNTNKVKYIDKEFNQYLIDNNIN